MTVTFFFFFLFLFCFFVVSINAELTNNNDITIAIDIGTTFSCVAVLHNGIPVVLPTSDSGATTMMPSIVAFGTNEDDVVLVGHDASDALGFGTVNPANVVTDVKRLLGRKLRHIAKKSELAYKLIDASDDDDDGVAIELFIGAERRHFSPEIVAAHLIRKLKEVAESHLSHSVSRAITAVPAYFDDERRAAVRRAFALAELELVDIVDEPVAIAASTLSADERRHTDVLVMHWGGATFEAALLERDAVRRAVRDESLGGVDLDRCLARQFVFHSSLRLLRECARVKHALATRNESAVEFGDALVPVSRASFEELCDALFVRAFDLLEQLAPPHDERRSSLVVLAGGSTRLRRVRELAASKFTIDRIRQLLNPDESVVRGLVLRCTDAGAHWLAASQAVGVAIGGGWTAEVASIGTALPATRFVSPTADGALRFFRGSSARCVDNAPFGELHVANSETPSDEIAVIVGLDGVERVRDEHAHSEL